MSADDMQLLLTEFNKQFNDLRKDLNIAIEKISDKIIILGESSLSCSKDIAATRLWYDDKTKDMEKDIDGIGESTRRLKKDIMENVDDKIKTNEEKTKIGNLTTRLMVAGSLISGMGAIILFLLNKYL